MAAPKRTKLQREEDLARLAGLYLRGLLQAEIAREMGVTQQQISYDLKVLQKRWQAASIRDLDAAKGQELAKIDELERTYWDAWKKSCGERQTTSTEKIDGGEDRRKRFKALVRKETMLGNPTYLQGVQWCIERRCRLLGLDAPDKSSILNLDITQCTDEQLQRIANGEDPWRVLAGPGQGGTGTQAAPGSASRGDGAPGR